MKVTPTVLQSSVFALVFIYRRSVSSVVKLEVNTCRGLCLSDMAAV